MEPSQLETAVVNSTDEALDMWAFVEIMGHSKLAGRLTTRKLGTQVMLQVDVLTPDGSAVAYSKLYGPQSIFSITPVNREWCQNWSRQAADYDFKPVPYIPEARQLERGSTEPQELWEDSDHPDDCQCEGCVPIDDED